MNNLFTIISYILIISAFALTNPLSAAETPVYGYKLVNTYPHDPNAFTQGLVLDGGFLYEGTGLHGKSSLRRVDLKSGKILKLIQLDPAYFGEGITIIGNRIIQLTWKSRKGFVYNKVTFRRLAEFSFPTEGWGITFDGHHFILSDGTDVLYYLDPVKFKPVRSISIKDNGIPVQYLNELEYIKGEIYANIWGRDLIARISPKTGNVTGWIDLSELRTKLDRNGDAEVLNGIGFNAEKNTLLITGKNWPKLFEIRITSK
jgi:glutamine cyclotransferase